MGKGGLAGDEGKGSVDRINDEYMFAIEAGGGIGGFLGEPAIAGAGGTQADTEHVVDGEIGLGNRAVTAGFVPDLRRALPEAQGDLAGGGGGSDQQGKVRLRQGSSRRSAGWAPLCQGGRGHRWPG